MTKTGICLNAIQTPFKRHSNDFQTGFQMSYKGVFYRKQIEAVNSIYDAHIKSGLSNREIWRRYIYPRFGISERTFYNYLKKGG